MASFRLQGLPAAAFAAWHGCDDAVLAEHGIRRVRADTAHGYPCRVSLRDADAGETLLLLHHEHHPVRSPYRASGPIYVRASARDASLAVDAVPDYVARRLISLRAYDAAAMMLMAEVCEGTDVAAWLHRTFDDARVAYVHLHNARQGCYSCRAERG